MTLPPEKLGDKGQRWIVELLGYPRDDTDEWQPAAYVTTEEAALEVARLFLECPGCVNARARDREVG